MLLIYSRQIYRVIRSCTRGKNEEYNVTIDYKKLVCAAGALQGGSATITVDDENYKVMVAQEAQTRWSVVANPTDVLYVIVYEKTEKKIIAEPCRSRKESGSTSISLDEGWKKKAFWRVCSEQISKLFRSVLFAGLIFICNFAPVLEKYNV